MTGLIPQVDSAHRLQQANAVAKTDLGGASAWGTILAASGIGSVAGGLVLLRVQPRQPLLVVVVAGTLCFAAPLALLAVRAPVRSLRRVRSSPESAPVGATAEPAEVAAAGPPGQITGAGHGADHGAVSSGT